MTAGLAFEALNHAGEVDEDLLVILNDNAMSISENVGGLSRYFARIFASRLYASVREGSKRVLKRIPGASGVVRRAEEHMKGMVVPGTLFEELGFNYIGPVDGHNLDELLSAFRTLKYLRGPQFLHVITQKEGLQACGAGSPRHAFPGKGKAQGQSTAQQRANTPTSRAVARRYGGGRSQTRA